MVSFGGPCSGLALKLVDTGECVQTFSISVSWQVTLGNAMLDCLCSSGEK